MFIVYKRLNINKFRLHIYLELKYRLVFFFNLKSLRVWVDSTQRLVMEG